MPREQPDLSHDMHKAEAEVHQSDSEDGVLKDDVLHHNQLASLGAQASNGSAPVPEGEFFIGQIGWYPVASLVRDRNCASIIKTVIGNFVTK